MQWMLLVSALALGAWAAHAGAAVKSVSKQDKTWLVKAHQANLAEINAGMMAKRDGHSKEVRLAGDTLITDHTMLDGSMKPAAYDLGVRLPDAPSARQQAKAKKLEGKKGMAFDNAWTQAMIKAHKKAIALTKNEIGHGSSPRVKQLAKTTLPVLEKHLEMLKGIKKG
jgi:putative membrane protein